MERRLDAGVRFDYADASTFDAALDGVDTVFVLAPAGHARSDILAEAFLDRATKRVRKIVTMTADGVQYDDTTPLRKIELRVAQSGVAYVHLRPGWFMQNFHTYWLPTIQARRGGAASRPRPSTDVPVQHGARRRGIAGARDGRVGPGSAAEDAHGVRRRSRRALEALTRSIG